MIPVPITELEPYVLKNENDIKYKNLILAELRYINKNSKKIIKYAKNLYAQKAKELDVNYIKNTVNFKLLEEKLSKWNKEN